MLARRSKRANKQTQAKGTSRYRVVGRPAGGAAGGAHGQLVGGPAAEPTDRWLPRGDERPARCGLPVDSDEANASERRRPLGARRTASIPGPGQGRGSAPAVAGGRLRVSRAAWVDREVSEPAGSINRRGLGTESRAPGQLGASPPGREAKDRSRRGGASRSSPLAIHRGGGVR